MGPITPCQNSIYSLSPTSKKKIICSSLRNSSTSSPCVWSPCSPTSRNPAKGPWPDSSNWWSGRTSPLFLTPKKWLKGGLAPFTKGRRSFTPKGSSKPGRCPVTAMTAMSYSIFSMKSAFWIRSGTSPSWPPSSISEHATVIISLWWPNMRPRSSSYARNRKVRWTKIAWTSFWRFFTKFWKGSPCCTKTESPIMTSSAITFSSRRGPATIRPCWAILENRAERIPPAPSKLKIKARSASRPLNYCT